MINEDKEELENTLCHTYAIREEERVSMAQNNIIISSESSSSDESLETSPVGKKTMSGNDITIFLLHVDQCIIYCQCM